jgi:hypothetical protein
VLRDPSGFVIKGRTVLGKRPAPVMAAFSSQGPNAVNPEILKVTISIPQLSSMLLIIWIDVFCSDMASPPF